MSTVPAPASTAEAMDMVRAGLAYLAAADPTALAPAGAQDTRTKDQRRWRTRCAGCENAS